MSITNAERRQIENEMIFRRDNEKVGDNLGALDVMHIEDGNAHLIRDEDLMLSFNCECSDENCTVRIPMLLSEYQKIHINRDAFVVLPDHQVDPIEKIISESPMYNVVIKNNSIPEPSGDLNKTVINNS
ncbi:MAG: hypothetical protein ABWX90_01745 [Candidatus Saccharimonadales bacterium]